MAKYYLKSPLGKGSKKKKKVDFSTFGSDPPPKGGLKKKHVVFLGFLAHFEQKKFWKFFHLENFLTSSMYGLIFMILGHGGSSKGKSGQIFLLFLVASLYDAFESMMVK